MSSREFSAELKPENHLRNLVMLSAAVAAIAGFVLIIHMPIDATWRALLALGWNSHCVLELLSRARAASRIARICIDNRGQMRIAGRNGKTEPVLLLSGSMVLGRIAWLRFRFEDGESYAELLCGNAVKDPQWHRFQLIWQQTRQIIGRADRS